MKTILSRWSLPAVLAAGFGATLAATAQSAPAGLKVDPEYTVTVFAQSINGYSAPDSIAVTHDRVYIGYGNDGAPDGSDGKSSNIVEYLKDGTIVHVYTVVGHNDGLKIDPATHKLWAMQNEDGNPNLVIIDPTTHFQKVYTFGPTPHGGGYDDITFSAGRVYFSASNPLHNPNAFPAIVEATFSGSTVQVWPVLEGNAEATDIFTGNPVMLNLQDPDSMTLDPYGDLLLDSQGDSELIVVGNPGAKSQSVIQVPLNSALGTPQIDDTIFIPNLDGFFLVADTPAGIVYAVHRGAFAPGTAFSAAVAGSTGFVGQLDMQHGHLATVVSGMQSPHGMAFVPAGDQEYLPD